MAQTTCAKCGGTSFELVLVDPARSNYKFNSLQCSRCGVSLGVLSYYDPGVVGNEVKKLVLDLSNTVKYLQAEVANIGQMVRQLR